MCGLLRSLVTLTFLLLAGMAQANDTLFTVKIPLSENSEQQTTQERFNQALSEAAMYELIRLSGRLDINGADEAQTFLTQPRSWLASYRYQPVKEEGVVVGTQIEFQFDEGRIYDYFQQHGLVIWPFERRPKTLVMGTRQLGGREIRLDQQNLTYLPNLNFHNAAQRMGLPIELPKDTKMWVGATANVKDKKVAYILSEYDSDFLLVFDSSVGVNGQSQFFWKLYRSSGQLLREGQSSEKAVESDLDNLFASLLNYYSQSYRDQADVLDEVNVSIKGLRKLDSLTQIESSLQNEKPLIHHVSLQSLKNYQATFELVYQGDYQYLVSKLRAFSQLKMLSDDAVTGRIEMEWVDAENAPKVVDFGNLASPEDIDAP